MVRYMSCPSNEISNARPKMCIHITSNIPETAIQAVHAVEETHLATVESTLQQVYRTTLVVNPATARPRKKQKKDNTRTAWVIPGTPVLGLAALHA